MSEAPDLREQEDCPSVTACDGRCDQHEPSPLDKEAREKLARVLSEVTLGMYFNHRAADAILASDWLAAYLAAQRLRAHEGACPIHGSGATVFSDGRCSWCAATETEVERLREFADRAKSCARHPHWSGMAWDCTFCNEAVREVERLQGLVTYYEDKYNEAHDVAPEGEPS